MALILKPSTNVPARACGVACFAVIAAFYLTKQTTHHEEENGMDAEILLQVRTHVSHDSSLEDEHLQQSKRQSCSELKNRGSHFTVEIEVGTPGQKFDIVADTGSDNLWVASCACKTLGRCLNAEHCFTGTNKSSTFSIQNGARGPPAVKITYGSGPVEMVMSSDVVNIGGIKTMMNNSLFLAVDHNLKLAEQIEGILGLGIPHNLTALNAMSEEQPIHELPRSTTRRTTISPTNGDMARVIEKLLRGILGMAPPAGIASAIDALGYYMSRGAPQDSSSLPQKSATGDTQILVDSMGSFDAAQKGGHMNDEVAYNEVTKPKSFLEQSGVDTFQLCFNDGDTDGALRLGTPAAPVELESVGTFHWGLDFQGISVGKSSAPVLNFCNSMDAGQETACAAIPDSGTTLIMVPSTRELVAILAGICSDWDRCKKYHKRLVHVEDLAGDRNTSEGADQTLMARVALTLLQRCDAWLTAEDGLTEIPSLHFHIAGKNKKKQTLELTPWAWVIETEVKDHKVTTQPLLLEYVDEVFVDLQESQARSGKTCKPAFEVFEYSTKKNGPVWIFGTSFFYQFSVGYNIKDKSMSFTSVNDAPCGGCGASLSQQGASLGHQAVQSARQRPRTLNAPPRISSIDTNLPL